MKFRTGFLMAMLLSGSAHALQDRQEPVRNPFTIAADEQRVAACMQCCQQRLTECRKAEGSTSERCQVLADNCANSCHSHGETPATWYCWKESS